MSTLNAINIKHPSSATNNIVTDASGNVTLGANSTFSANATFTGVTARFIGDFTNATVASRLAFQTGSTNSSTGIYALPSGTSTAASWQATNNSDPTNTSKVLIATNGSTDVQLVSGINGTGTYLPLSFYTNGTQQMQLSTSGVLTGTAGNLMLISGTAQATTSGTSIDFTGIPSWVKRVTVMFNGVSTSGSSPVLIQIGSGSVTTSGYTSGSIVAVTSGAGTILIASTAGFTQSLQAGDAAATTRFGSCILNLLGSNIWASTGGITGTTYGASTTGGVTLGGALDRVRITTVNGTDTFDAGSINIMYE